MKPVKNPLNSEETKAKVAKLFGEQLAQQICTKPVFKYTHPSKFDGIGTKRN